MSKFVAAIKLFSAALGCRQVVLLVYLFVTLCFQNILSVDSLKLDDFFVSVC